MFKKTLSKKGLPLALCLAMITASGCSDSAAPSPAQSGGTPPASGAESGDAAATTAGMEFTSPGEYTYNISNTTPRTWNPHEGGDGNDKLKELTNFGFWSLVLNDTKDGYKFQDEMAVGEPVDVTKDYAGNETFGVPADAGQGWAYKVTLNDKACWEDGVPITADDYIYSYSQLLSPEMKCEMASNMYADTILIANAEKYVKQGQEVHTPIAQDGGYRDVPDSEMEFSFTKDVFFFAASAKSNYEGGSKDNFIRDGVDLYEKYSKQDYYPLTEEAKEDIIYIAGKFGDTGADAYKEFCSTFDGIPPEMSFDDVGIIKTGDYELVFVLGKETTPFFFQYGLGTYLVNKELYEANKKQTGDIVKTTYATSVETFKAYGPYKLVSFQPDKQYILEKNDKWFGYTDGKHEGQYQTTRVVANTIGEQATILQLFLQGKLDSTSLTPENMATYRNSDFIQFTPNSYANKITFNSDRASLTSRQTAGKNKLILSYPEFRKAVSLSLDREKFAAECYATSQPGFGLLNNLYVSNVETGERYRDTAQGQQVLKDVYGVSDLSHLTGYDRDEASRLFTEAYDKALAAGDIQENDGVEIEFVVYKTTDSNLKIANFVKEAVTQAAVGSKLEGKIEFKITADEDYYAHSKSGLFDIIITSWGGNDFNPFGVMDVYCNEEKIFEYGFKPSVEQLTINLDGQDIVKTYKQWCDALNSGEYSAADYNTRTTILAAIEKGILNKYICPVYLYSTTTGLHSRKVKFAAEEYVANVGFGGVRFMTYNADDAEWAQYCKDNNYQISY